MPINKTSDLKTTGALSVASRNGNQAKRNRDENALDAIIEADFDSPARFKYGNCPKSENPAYRYYLGVRPQIAEWWEDFNNTLDAKTGGPKYRSIHQFAVSKSKNPREQSWIEGMIGSAPLTFAVRKGRKPGVRYLKIPWMGDWKAKRANGYWAPEQPAKIKALARAIKEKLVAWEAVRSSAPYLVREMAGFERLSEQVDAAFNGQPFDPEKGPMDPENRARFESYFAMKKGITEMKLRLMDQWMLVHGVNPKDPVQLTQVNQIMAQVSSPAQMAGIAGTMAQRDLEAVKMVRMLQLQAENFKMPLPESLTGRKPDVVDVVIKRVKGNGNSGKVM